MRGCATALWQSWQVSSVSKHMSSSALKACSLSDKGTGLRGTDLLGWRVEQIGGCATTPWQVSLLSNAMPSSIAMLAKLHRQVTGLRGTQPPGWRERCSRRRAAQQRPGKACR